MLNETKQTQGHETRLFAHRSGFSTILRGVDVEETRMESNQSCLFADTRASNLVPRSRNSGQTMFDS